MTDTTDWRPSDKMVSTAITTFFNSNDKYERWNEALIAVRPLMREEIIAEERPKIEAAERGRIAQHYDAQARLLCDMAGVYPGDPMGDMMRDVNMLERIAEEIRALKDSKP